MIATAIAATVLATCTPPQIQCAVPGGIDCPDSESSMCEAGCATAMEQDVADAAKERDAAWCACSVFDIACKTAADGAFAIKCLQATTTYYLCIDACGCTVVSQARVELAVIEAYESMFGR